MGYVGIHRVRSATGGVSFGCIVAFPDYSPGMSWFWISRLKYPTLGDVNHDADGNTIPSMLLGDPEAGSHAAFMESMKNPEWERRFDAFERGQKEYNSTLIFWLVLLGVLFVVIGGAFLLD